MAYIEDLGDGKYKVYVDVGYVRGRRVRRTKTITATSNRDLNRQARDFEFECMQKQDEPIDDISFSGFVDRWLNNYVRVDLKLTSRDTYMGILDNHLMDYFGNMKLKDIKKFHIVEYFAERKDEANLPGRYKVLRSIFSRAIEWEVLKDNPTIGIKEPEPKNKRKINFYTENEIEHLSRVLDNVYPKHRMMIKIAFTGGLRRAEIAGIREESINYDENYIYVDKQLRYDKETQSFYMSSTKNNKPRHVYFSDKFMKELKQYHTKFKEQRFAMGNLWNPLKDNDGKEINLLFVKENGFPTHLNSISNEWRKIIKRYKLKHITFHELRHTCASLMVKKGINFKVIQERLGHADIGITIDRYSHLENDQHVEGANIFDDVL